MNINSKRNTLLKIPFAAPWMDPEIVILSELSETEKEEYCMILQRTYFIKQKQAHRLKRTNPWLPQGRDSQGVWDEHVHTIIFKMNNQQRPIAQHRKLCSIFCNNLNGKRI